jgi:hypothetical protein
LTKESTSTDARAFLNYMETSPAADRAFAKQGFAVLAPAH